MTREEAKEIIKQCITRRFCEEDDNGNDNTCKYYKNKDCLFYGTHGLPYEAYPEDIIKHHNKMIKDKLDKI